MNTIVKILIFLLVIVAEACNIYEPCGECFSPPRAFYFEILDKNSGENLFTNGTFNVSDLDVFNTTTNTSMEFNFISADSLNILEIYTIGWQSEKATYEISIADSAIFELFVNAERVFEDCCSFTRFHEIRIDNAEYEHSYESEIYKIFLHD